ncbi:MAG: acyltransferase [Verrucomicrobia bacterium]|nr:acyltransferase [Verrucomicrobiota bacterium]
MAGALGSMMILAGYLGISDSGGFPGSVAWVPAGGTLLVLAGVSRADSWSAKLLSHPAAVVIGKMSYSIYLWHWPAIVLARHYAELHDLGTRRSASVVGMLAGVGLAWVAYRWIEAPMRMGAVHRSKKIILLGGGFVGVLILAQGLPSSASTTGQAHLNFSPLVFRGMEFSLAPEAGAFASLATRYRDVEFPFVKLAETQVWLNGGILKPHGGTNAPKVVVFGSSHALMYGGEIDDLCRERSWTAAYFCADGVSPLYPTQTCELLPTAEAVRGFDRARLGWLTRWHPEWLVVVDRWDRFGSLADFESQVRALLEAVRGKVGQVLFISQVPVLRLGEAVNLREYARWNYQRSGQMPEISADQRAARRQQQRELLRRIVQECPYARLLDPGPFFEQAGGRVRYYEGDKFFYADDDHLSQFGSSLIRPLLEQHFGALPSKKVLN